MGYNPEIDISAFECYCAWYYQYRNINPTYLKWINENNASSMSATFHRFNSAEDRLIFKIKYGI